MVLDQPLFKKTNEQQMSVGTWYLGSLRVIVVSVKGYCSDVQTTLKI